MTEYIYDWKIYSISNKSTKNIQVQLYTIVKKEKDMRCIYLKEE